MLTVWGLDHLDWLLLFVRHWPFGRGCGGCVWRVWRCRSPFSARTAKVNSPEAEALLSNRSLKELFVRHGPFCCWNHEKPWKTCRKASGLHFPTLHNHICHILSHTKRNQIVLRALLLIPRAAQICHLVPLIASGTSQAQIETKKRADVPRRFEMFWVWSGMEWPCDVISGVGRVGCMLCHLWHGGSLLSFSKTSNLINEEILRNGHVQVSRRTRERKKYEKHETKWRWL